MSRLAILAIVATGCGHAFHVAAGASRRGDGKLGALATVGAELHAFSDGHGRAAFVPIGVRVGGGIDADGATRAIVDVAIGLGRLPVGRGWTGRAEVRAGTGIGGALELGVASGHTGDRVNTSYFPGTKTSFATLHFISLGVAAGAEHSFVDGDGWLDLSLVARWGTAANDVEAEGD